VKIRETRFLVEFPPAAYTKSVSGLVGYEIGSRTVDILTTSLVHRRTWLEQEQLLNARSRVIGHTFELIYILSIGKGTIAVVSHFLPSSACESK
jgi:hypothetical protein